jgi:hypothetical protein
MSTMASPALVTACSATATNDRPAGSLRNSEVWLRNTRRGRGTTKSHPLPRSQTRPSAGRADLRPRSADRPR